MSTYPSPLANAFATNEGYYVSGSTPSVTNNPGDLKIGDVGYGTTASGITIFGSIEDGWNALENQLSLMVNGGSSVYSPSQSIGSAINTYTGGGPNAVSNITSQLGVSPSAPLSSLSGQLGSSSTSGSTLSNLFNNTPNNVVATTAKGVASTVSGFAGFLKFIGNISFEDLVIFGLGVILIIAGLFSFDKVSSTVVSVAKTASKAAELTA